MSPHETLFLESTNALDVKYIANNAFVHFEIWDFPGDFDFSDELVLGDHVLTEELVFSSCGALIYVVDAQDDPSADSLSNLHQLAKRAHRINPNIHFEVFVHKVDGDLFLSEDHKVDCQRDIQQQVADELEDANLDINFSFYLTSIYDHSIFESFSKVVQKLIPQLPTMENLLNIFITNCNIEKAFIFDVVSKLYIGTDSNPVDIQSYELCSDMIDVVIDVSCIYGMKEDQESYAYDAESSSVIRLNNEMVLYLREISHFLALVCLVRAPNFKKQGLIDYNINQFKLAINDVFNVEPSAVKKGASSPVKESNNSAENEANAADKRKRTNGKGDDNNNNNGGVDEAAPEIGEAAAVPSPE